MGGVTRTEEGDNAPKGRGGDAPAGGRGNPERGYIGTNRLREGDHGLRLHGVEVVRHTPQPPDHGGAPTGDIGGFGGFSRAALSPE